MCNSSKAEYKNEYYDRANGLYKQALASPNKADFIDQLILDAGSTDPWTRNYAVVFLGLLGKEKALDEIQRLRIIEILRKSISDKEPAIKSASVNAIRDIGEKAVIIALPELISLVETGQENGFNWSAAEALGKVRSKDKATEIVSVLLRAACRPRIQSLPSGTPELRIFAARALVELIEVNRLSARDALLLLKEHLPPADLAEKIDDLSRK